MYIIKNAFRCISRAKGRSILIGLVVLLLSVSSCIGLSIKEANRTLKKQYADEGKCVIIVTHSPEVSKLSDVVYELKAKK